MSVILTVDSPEQTTTLMKNKLLAAGVGITALNQGCDVLNLLEAVAIINSTTGSEMLAALLRAIPIMFFEGLGFAKKGAVASSGYLRFYRIPLMIVRYTGAGSSCLVSKNASTFSSIVTGAPLDDLSINLSGLTTISDLATAIGLASANYTVTVPSGMGAQPITAMAAYASKEIVGATSYLLTAGAGFMSVTLADLATIPQGTIVTANNLQYITTAAGTIPAGSDTSAAITAQCTSTGGGTDLGAGQIDTYNGTGAMTGSLPEVQYVINDVAFSGGLDAETDAQRNLRFQTEIRGVVPGGKSTVESAVNKLSWVRSCVLVSAYPSPGYATLVVDNGTGGALTGAQVTELTTLVVGDPNNIAVYPGVGVVGITYQYTAPTWNYLSVSLTVTRQGSVSDAAEITAAVQTAISSYINTLPIGKSAILEKMVAVAMDSHPMVYDVAFIAPTGNTNVNAVTIIRNTSVSVSIATI